MPRRAPVDLDELLARWGAPGASEAGPAGARSGEAAAEAGPEGGAPAAGATAGARPARGEPSALFARLREALARALGPESKELAAAMRLVDNIQRMDVTAGPEPIAKALDELEDLLEGLWIAAEERRRRDGSG